MAAPPKKREPTVLKDTKAYKRVVGGGLKLKGAPAPTISKGKGTSVKQDRELQEKAVDHVLAKKAEAEAAAAAAAESGGAGEQSGSSAAAGESGGSSSSSSSSSSSTPAVPSVDRRTKTEIAFEEAQMRRERDIIKKKITKTHRQRIEEYNAYLENLSEHYDIPRVGPG